MKINDESRNRFYKEISIQLAREDFSVQEPQNGLLPIEWHGAGRPPRRSGRSIRYLGMGLRAYGDVAGALLRQ